MKIIFWMLALGYGLTFWAGYGLRMYQHPIGTQTEQERYEAGWYRVYIESYLPPGYETPEEEPKSKDKNLKN